MEQVIAKVSNMARAITQLSVTLIVTFLMVDILFPGSTGMAANVGAVASSLSEKGLAGLVALGLFYVVYTKAPASAASPSSESSGSY
ncbi:MAG: hypothetical protein QF404_12140 [Planctomycetota bacterium]|jgi:hypothetical protein|nr:hypothetical protein [Planctomycetota bacterium]MDP6939234.1 hypothetical protein [Planctomycetota bacterium]